MSLFPNLRPLAAPLGIDLRLCGIDDLRDVSGARMVMADPPWLYTREAGVANPETNGIYEGLEPTDIARHLDLSYDFAGPSCRLVCWYTWPKDAEWSAAGGAGPRWGPRVTGGVWVKLQQVGVGYHWRGQSEPVAVFTKGACGRPSELLLNEHRSPPASHSEKPVEWLRAWVRAWTDPGDLVVDLYAGLAPMARACLHEGRRYVGAEIDPDRHAAALVALAEYRMREGL